MMHKGHMLVGATGANLVAAISSMPFSIYIWWAPIVVVCSLFPDLDGKRSRLSTIIPPVAWAMRRLAKYVYIKTKLPADDRVARVHRGLTHTPVFIVILSFILYVVLLSFEVEYAALISSAFLYGNILHLLGDGFSLSGLPLLYPIRRDNKRWWDVKVPAPIRFRVGGALETTILTPLVGLTTLVTFMWYTLTKINWEVLAWVS